jgi:hypothetical protein
MITSDILGTARTSTDEVDATRRRFWAPGSFHDARLELASLWWARASERIGKALRRLTEPPSTEFTRWYETECSITDDGGGIEYAITTACGSGTPGGGAAHSAYQIEECRRSAAMSVEPAAPSVYVGPEKDSSVSSGRREGDAAALGARPVRVDGRSAGADRVGTPSVQVASR